MSSLKLAQLTTPPNPAGPANPFGKVSPPPGVSKYNTGSEGLVSFIANGIRLLIIIASLYVLFNLIFAGYQFISAGGDPKKIEDAWNKIWHSLFGLFLIAGSFVLAAIFGQIIFGDARFILNPDFSQLAP